MSVWLREVVGWLLLGAGVAVFGLVYLFLANRRLLECAPLSLIGFFLFRGGLHLLKVASAARAMRDAGRPVAQPPARRLVAARTAGRPGELRPSVVPGRRAE